MIESPVVHPIAGRLLEIALDPTLRQELYVQLGEYCHLCRNRLNSLKLSLFLAMKQAPGPRSGDWTQLEREYLKLERVVERLQTLCRPMALSKVTLALDLLIEDRRDEWIRLMAEDDCDLECLPPQTRAVVAFDVERMSQALDAMVAWRAGGGGPDRSARLRWWVDAGTAHVDWEERAPGPRPGAARPPAEEAKWHLPLVARVVQAHGGEFHVSEEDGCRLHLSWPATTASA